MHRESKLLAGLLLVILPTVMIGGGSLLAFLIDEDSPYAKNPLRQDLFRAGHAHAGVFLILALLILRYVDEADLPAALKRLVRFGAPAAAILLPAGFFLSVIPPDATRPNALVHLGYAGGAVLAFAVVTLGVGLLRRGGSRA
jgi:hypothetical protein